MDTQVITCSSASYRFCTLMAVTFTSRANRAQDAHLQPHTHTNTQSPPGCRSHSTYSVKRTGVTLLTEETAAEKETETLREGERERKQLMLVSEVRGHTHGLRLISSRTTVLGLTWTQSYEVQSSVLLLSSAHMSRSCKLVHNQEQSKML